LATGSQNYSLMKEVEPVVVCLLFCSARDADGVGHGLALAVALRWRMSEPVTSGKLKALHLFANVIQASRKRPAVGIPRCSKAVREKSAEQYRTHSQFSRGPGLATTHTVLTGVRCTTGQTGVSSLSPGNAGAGNR
jgi:hypothetical protein